MLQDKEEYWYGFPAYDHKGMKIGKFNHLREVIDPDKQDKQVTAADEEVGCRLPSCSHLLCDLVPQHAQERDSLLVAFTCSPTLCPCYTACCAQACTLV